MDLSDVDGLEHLAWVVYNGIFIPGNPPRLISHHDWSCIIAGMTFHLIYHGKTVGEHCPPCTVASFNARCATRLVQQQGLWQLDKKRKPPAMLATETPRSTTVKSVVNIPPQGASFHSADGVPAVSLDHNKEEEEEKSFHKFHHHRMMQCLSISWHTDPTWQTAKWLQTCEEGLDDGEISWWLLVSLLTDGSNTAAKDLTRQLVATWRWAGKVSKTPVCWPSLTVLNIGQFLDGDAGEQGWDQPQWLLAYAHALQHIGEVADRRTWSPDGKRFTPEISQLVHAFTDETWPELVEAEVALCWNEPPQEVPCQMDEGPFVEVISHLDQLAKHLLRRWAWDELLFLPPQPNLACLAGVDTWGTLWQLGQMLPSL